MQHAGSFVEGHRLFSSCGSRASLLRGLWDLGSLTRDQTGVPCIVSQILNQWATREVLAIFDMEDVPATL